MSEINRQQRVTCCVSLHSREPQAPILDRIITGDENWIFYNNVKRKKVVVQIQFRSLDVDCTLKNYFVCMVELEGYCLL